MQVSFPEIPWRTRRDQIGVLCAAIDRFRTALLRLQEEEQRKKHNQRQIEHLVENMTQTIHGLDRQASEMVQMALTLQELAGKTEAVSTDVAGLADDSARRSVEVGDSSQQINYAVGDIYRELEVQNREVGRFCGRSRTGTATAGKVEPFSRRNRHHCGHGPNHHRPD